MFPSCRLRAHPTSIPISRATASTAFRAAATRPFYSDIERGTATLRAAGLDAAYETQLAERPVTFNARLAYLDRRTEGGTASASFAALPGASYALASLAPEGGAVQAGLGAQMALGPDSRLRFDLAGEWGRDYQEWTAAFGLDIQW